MLDRFRLAAVALLVGAAGLSRAAAPDAEGVLRAGVARIDITPARPVLLGGYGSRKEPSTGVHDPLSARVVAFERDGRRLVLVSTDLLGFYGGTVEPLRKSILEAARLEPSELFLCAIHGHSSPILVADEAGQHPANVEYSRDLAGKLASLVRSALDRLSPVEIAAGGGASPVGVNRRQVARTADGGERVVLGRNPSVATDREVQVLRVSRLGETKPAALLFAYPTHATSLGPRNLLVSGDVLGLAEQFIERHLGEGTVAPAFAGASGDIDPWHRVLPGFESADGWIPEPVLLGTLLGEEVVTVARGLTPGSCRGPIRTAIREIALPRKPGGDGKPPEGSVPLTVTVGRIGDIAFVGLGCEAFNEIGRAIKSRSPFPTTVVITHANGAAGYLPTREAYREGGYEIDTTRVAPGADEVTIREVLRLLEELRAP